MAAWHGDQGILQVLLAAPGIDVNLRGHGKVAGWVANRSVTPLQVAAFTGDLGTLKALLAAPGIDPNCTQPAGKTAKRRTSSKAKALSATSPPLYLAVNRGHLGCTRLLLEAGAIAPSDNLVMAAILGRHSSVLRAVIASGTDPNINKAVSGQTPLLVGCLGHAQI